MIKINEIEEIPATLFDSKGNCIGVINTQLQFVDVLCQIKEEKAKGYYLMFNNIKCIIDSHGNLDNYPEGLFDKMSGYYAELI